MRAKLKKAALNIEGKNLNYNVVLESPAGKALLIQFNFVRALKTYFPLEVTYDGNDKGSMLAWYTRGVEDMAVHDFLKEIAENINHQYGDQSERNISYY